MRVPRPRLVLAMLASLAVLATGWSPTTPTASAAVSFNWFTQLPGFISTDLVATDLGYSPADDSLYVATESGGVVTLLKIDVAPLEIVDQTTVPIVGDVRDIEASEDGSAVYVIGSEQVFKADGSDLTSLFQVASLDPGDWSIDVAPGDPDRFVLWDATASRVSVYDGEISTPITAVSSGPDAGVVFAESDGRLLSIADGTFVEVDIATDTPVRSDPVSVTGVQDVFELVDGALWIDGLVIDPATLTTRATFAGNVDVFRQGRVALVGDTAFHRTIIDTATLQPVGEFEIPDRGAADLAAAELLGDDELAILEFGAVDPNRLFLSVVSSRRLSSGTGEYHAVDPFRVLDTRTGVGAGGFTGKIGPDRTRRVRIAGAGGVPDAGVGAVVMNATVTEPTAASYFSIWPSGLERPEVSNLNFVAGQTVPNLVTVAVGENGSVDIFNKHGSAHAILDVMGYYADVDGARGARYVPLASPIRIVDTRLGRGGSRLGPAGEIDVDFSPVLTGVGSDDTVVAVAANTTVVTPTAASFLTLRPADVPLPLVSNLNYLPGDVRANMTIIGVEESTTTATVYNLAGQVDVVMDVVGYYVRPATPATHQAGRLLPVAPFREFDSREDFVFPAPGRIPAAAGVIFDSAPGWTDIVNVTAVTPTEAGFLSVVPFTDSGRPPIETSNVNFFPGDVVANSAYATSDPDYLVYNSAGDTHIVVDVFGYLTPTTLPPPDIVWD